MEAKQEKVNGLGKKMDQRKNRLMEFTDQVSIREKEVNDLRADKLKLQTQLQVWVLLFTSRRWLREINMVNYRIINWIINIPKVL